MARVYINPETIKQYLKSHRGIFKTTLGAELISALVLSTYYKKEQNLDFLVGFPIPDSLNKKGHESGSIQRLEQIFGELLVTDTPVDFSLVQPHIAETRKPFGYNFQVKRVGTGGRLGDTNEIIEEINSKIREYGKIDAQLLLILEPNSTNPINFPRIVDEIETDKYPFQKILFIATRDNPEIIMVGEIWPCHGWNEYPAKDFFV